MMKATMSFLIVLVFASPVFGQDLDTLQDRVQGLWNALTSSESLRALDYVEEASRARFLEREPDNVMTASVVGLEFTDDPSVVSVQVRTTVMLAQLGGVERVSSEVWIWDGGNWFLRIPEGGMETPFGGTAAFGERPPRAERDRLPRIEFLVDALDLGHHVQGAQTEGALPFRLESGTIRSIRPSGALGSIPGLDFGAVEWVDEENGRLPYTWDTTLVSADVEEVVAFSVRDLGTRQALVPLMIVGDIEPRIRFTQVPDIVDMSKAGSFELIIENISHEPFGVLRTTSQNSDYEFDTAWPELLRPGMSGKVTVRYPAENDPKRISVVVTFRGLVLGQRKVTLKPVLVGSAKRGYTAEEREEMMRAIERGRRTPGPPPE